MFLVVLIVSTLGAPFGLEVVHSPLLITLTVNILVTEIIAIFTAVTAERKNGAQARRAQKKAVTTFIFANALSALAVLTNSFMETVELREVTAVNGLSLLLEVWIVREDNRFVEVYRNALGSIMLAALVVALHGASLFTSRENSQSAPPVSSIFVSLVLMILGALIGTHWREVPFESRHIMGTWGSIVTWGTALALFVFTLATSLVIALATIRVVSLSVFGVVRDGQRILATGIASVLSLVSWEILKGTLLGVVLILTLIATYNVATLLILSFFGTLPETEISSIAAGLVRLNTQSLPIIQKWALGLTAVAVFGIGVGGIAPSISHAVAAMLKSSRRFAAMITVRSRSVLRNALKIRFSGIRLQFPAGGRLSESASLLVNKIRTAAIRARSIDLLSWVPLLLTCSLVSSTSSITDQYLGEWGDNRVIERPEIEPEISESESKAVPFLKRMIDALNEIQESRENENPVVEPKIGWEIQALRICDTVYVAPEWQIGSSEDLEVPLSSCRLSTEASKSDGILVVVGAASYEPSAARTEREIVRAKQRGAALANWAADQISTSQKILVLNLGMAKSATRRRPANSVLASLIYDRPATAILLRPPNTSSTIGEDEALLRLRELLSEELFSDEFTNCELFGFDRLERELDTQPHFVCDAPD